MTGRSAIRRINQMHRSYDISNDDMRYVLCTFVVIPGRWLDAYGWRRLSDHERRAMAVYYATLGRHMGIQDIPRTYAEFEQCLDAYEAAHFGWSEGGRRVSDATLDLMASWYPRPPSRLWCAVQARLCWASPSCAPSTTNVRTRPPVP
ncbi:hypothetical protein GCM10020000_10140 [Streptomyces olivoverticillatus]